ncbi:MAG: MerR family transcriptional regulator [Rubrivivax sp. SCN 70-15]|nr:MAG: MerR family transcriptional regulator [Rubrivivax sp. SCN 70-15]
MSIGALAQAAAVSVESIRFYQRRGLLSEPARAVGSIRRYGPAEAARVRFIKAAQRIGFTLDEVAQLLRLEDGTRCAEAREIGAGKLADVRARLADLHRIEAALTTLVDRCGTGRGALRCPLISALQDASPESASTRRR